MVLSAVLSCVIIDDDLYCVDGQIGCLYKIALKEWRLEFLGKLNFEWIQSKVTDLFLYQGSIWCIPLYSKQIAQYNLESKEITYYHSDYQEEGRLYTLLRNNVFYIIPLKPSEDLIEFHIKEKKFVINENWRKKIRKKNKECERFLMAAYDGDVLVITQKSTKEVLQIDFRDFDIIRSMLSVSDNLFGVVWMNGLFYYTAEKDRKVFVWNQKENVIQEYAEEKKYSKPYLRPVALFDRILLTDGKKQNCFKEGHFFEFQEIERIESIRERSSFYFHVYTWKGKLILPPCSANMFLKIDIGSWVAEGYIMELPMQDIWRSLQTHFLVDEKTWSLKTYLSVATEEEEISGSTKQKRDTYGTDIYETVVGGKYEL